MYELESLERTEKHGSKRPKKETMVLAHFNPREISAMNAAQGEVTKDAHGIPQFKNLWEHVLYHPQMQQNFKDHHENTKGHFHESDNMLERLKNHGRHGDTQLASIPTGMAELLDSVYGRSLNPKDGKHEYFNASGLSNFLQGAVSNIPFQAMKDMGKHAIKTGARALDLMRRNRPDVPAAPAAPAAPLGRLASMGRSAGAGVGKLLGSTAGAGLLGFAGSELGAHIGSQYGGQYGHLGRLAGAGLGVGLGGAAGTMLGKHYGGKYGAKLGGGAGEAVGNMAAAVPAAVGRSAARAGQAVANIPGHLADSAATAYRGLPEPVRNIAGGIAAEVPNIGSAAYRAMSAPANAFAAMHGPALSQDEATYRMFPQLRPQPQAPGPILDDVD